MDKPLFKLSAIFLLMAAIAGVFILVRPKVVKTTRTSYLPPVARAGTTKETQVDASDGKMSLMMKEEKGREGVTFSFLISNLADGSQKEIFRKTVAPGVTMSIPANTFSPDDKYFFLKESALSGAGYFVFSVTGNPLTKDSQTLEISSLFGGKFPDFKITDVTGWGGIDLIVFNTDKAAGGIGPSFWFEVPSHAFIRLTNRFN